LPIDLLPDRSVETVSAWLKEHPSLDTISRDGSSEYASAIKKGAPQAREVRDRWHLANLAGCVSVLLARSVSLSFVVQRLRQRPTRSSWSNPQASHKVMPGREPREVRNWPAKPSDEFVMSRSRLCTIKG
jgi:transposase